MNRAHLYHDALISGPK